LLSSWWLGEEEEERDDENEKREKKKGEGLFILEVGDDGMGSMGVGERFLGMGSGCDYSHP
jgi:hypothetical protein